VPRNTSSNEQLGKATGHRPGHLRHSRRGRHAKRSRIDPRTAVVAAGIALSAIGGVSWTTTSPPAKSDAKPANVVLADTANRTAAAEDRGARSHDRATAPPSNPPASSTTTAQKPAETPSPSPSSTSPASVAGLSRSQMDNAIAIVEAGRQLNLPRQALVVAISTALQESNLRNLANPGVPGSVNHPNEGVGYDHDSVGLFQQRPTGEPSTN
jgi:hypothetical protein